MDGDGVSPDPVDLPAGWASLAGAGAGVGSLTALASVDPAGLTGRELVDAVVASEKALSFLAATQMRLLVALAVPFKAGDPMRLAARLARKNRLSDDLSDEQVQVLVPDAAICLAAAEVAAALRIAPVTAGIRVREAGTMTTTLAPTFAALEAGVLDRGKARVIAEHCDPLSLQDTAQVQRLVLGSAGEVTTSELRDITARAVITVDPQGAKERHEAAAARRELVMSACPDAMASLKAFLPADGAVKIFQINDLLATATAGVMGDDRGIGARRVDALVDIAEQLLTHGHLDISDYVGNPLPDHGTPQRPDRAGRSSGLGGTDPDPTGSDSDPDPETTEPSTSNDSNPTTNNGDAASAAGTSGTGAAGGTSGTGAAGTSGTGTAGARTGSGDNDEEVCTGVGDGPDGDGPDGDAPDGDDVECSGSNGGETPGSVERGVPGETGGRSGPSSVGVPAGPVSRSLSRQGRRPHLSVTIGVGTLAGHDDLPGVLAGFGAIPAGLARSIAASAATITTLLVDPVTGAVSQAGELVYRPRQELRDQIAALLNVCQFPSCRQPVWRCDIDHREPFDHAHPEQGGRTTTENAGPFCRRHHLVKHHTEWRVHADPQSSTLIWISPTGHRYAKRRCQVAPPQMWVTTAATRLAERLDTLAVMAEFTAGTSAATNNATGGYGPTGNGPTSKDPTSKDPTSKDPTSKDPTGSDTGGKDTGGKVTGGKDTGGKVTGGKDTGGKDTGGKDTGGKDTPCNGTASPGTTWNGAGGHGTGSVTEELLTALLLRHQLNQRPMEYEPSAEAWYTTTNGDSTTTCDGATIGGTSGDNANHNSFPDPNLDDDPPPF